MLRTTVRYSFLLTSALLFSACDLEIPEKQAYALPPIATPQAKSDTVTEATAQNTDGAIELTWDDLVPADWRPDALLKEFNLDEMKDDDPRAKEYEARLKQLWDVAPVVKELEGKLVKLPGYVLPVEDNGQKVTEFLLVPYHGACIHVPAPPANQTVYVITGDAEAKIRKVFDTVWVTGIIKLEKADRELATSGYTLLATKVEPFE
ncbi:MAG: DUF3299 domain-containing protein [Gammaproteobacteria bacterium]|nr:DUF3299 domain-containing protein [Gammaproteobacteria bacterium]